MRLTPLCANFYNFSVRRPALFVLLLVVILLPRVPGHAQQRPVPPPPGKQEMPTIRRGVDLVNVVFSVLNRREKFVTELDKGNFRVFEDDKEQKVDFFSRETDLPLRIGLLLDTSNSIRERLKFEQEAATDFLHSVIRRNKDMAFLMIFDNEADVVQDFTEDLNKLTDTILRQRAAGGTALDDAIYRACRDKLFQAPPPEGPNKEMRRVLVVISDGVDTGSTEHTRSEAIEMCQRVEAAVYTISTSTDWVSITGTEPKKYHKTEGDKVLESIAEQTGGRAFFPYRIDDLNRSFQDIGDELRSQYSLAYVPGNRTLDGKFRAIRIEVDRKGLKVRARKGYFAPRGPVAAAAPGN
jgi:VWFA-related protein